MDDRADSHVCARCAAQSGTCCTLEPGLEEYCFPVSATERAAMEAAGARERHFCRQENTQAFVDNLCRLFGTEAGRMRALFPAGGFHDRLAVTKAGACALLGRRGCRLPRHARPYYCRIYPFWIRDGRQLYFQFEQCQAQQDAGGAPALLLRLGMTSAEIRRTYQELRRAWALPENE